MNDVGRLAEEGSCDAPRAKRRCGVLLGGSARPFYIGPKPYSEILAHINFGQKIMDEQRARRQTKARLDYLIRRHVSPADIAISRSGYTPGGKGRRGTAQSAALVIGLAASLGWTWDEGGSRWGRM